MDLWIPVVVLNMPRICMHTQLTNANCIHNLSETVKTYLYIGFKRPKMVSIILDHPVSIIRKLFLKVHILLNHTHIDVTYQHSRTTIDNFRKYDLQQKIHGFSRNCAQVLFLCGCSFMN
jgi:hypothetical protein